MTAPTSLPLTLPWLLATAADEVPDRVAIVEGEVELTYAGLAAAVDEVARALAARGVQPGDRVAIWASNSVRWAATAIAVAANDAVLVTLNTRYKGAEAAFVLSRSRARLCFVDDGFLDTNYSEMLRKVGLADLDLVTIGDAPSESTAWTEFLAAGADVDPALIAQRTAALDHQAMADLMFTSGTTGEPKGVMTGHAANIAVYEAWADMIGLTSADRYLLVNPLFHAFGYRAGLIAALVVRIPLFLLPTFEPVAAMELIESRAITFLPGAPAIYTTLLDHPERHRFDLSSLRLVVTGAAVVPMELIRRVRVELGVETVVTAYGQTEATGTITVCPPAAPDEKISRTAGVAIPGVEVRVIDKSGAVLPPGAPGEILSRGYNTMLGYLDDPAATAATIDEDGWLHTGDVGFLDEEGYLTITDRIKDMFTVGGFNVYPAEVERCLMLHPSVLDSAVVAVEDARLGEVGRAHVILRAGVEPTDETRAVLLAHCRENLANFKVPRSVFFTDALPRNPSGKVQKFRLTESSQESTHG